MKKSLYQGILATARLPRTERCRYCVRVSGLADEVIGFVEYGRRCGEKRYRTAFSKCYLGLDVQANQIMTFH